MRVPLVDDRGRRRGIPSRVHEAVELLFDDVVAVHVNVKGRSIFYAIGYVDGTVGPGYAIFALADEGHLDADPELVEIKGLLPNQAPRRWPRQVAKAITDWS